MRRFYSPSYFPLCSFRPAFSQFLRCSDKVLDLCTLSIDKERGECHLKINQPINRVAWSKVNLMLSPYNYSWDMSTMTWSATNLKVAVDAAKEAKDFLRKEVLNYEKQTSERQASDTELYERWADAEEKNFRKYLEDEGSDGKRTEKFLKLKMEESGALGKFVQGEEKNIDSDKSVDALHLSIESILSEKSDIIDDLLPSHVKKERFKLIIRDYLRRTEKLLELERSSIIECILSAAVLGLEVGSLSKECYFVPIAGRLRFIIGYQGLIRLASLTGDVVHITAKCVYKEDQFSYKNDEITHTPYHNIMERGDLSFAYVICLLKSGKKERVVLPMAYFQTRHTFSNPIRVQWEEEMCLKAAVKTLLKRLPLSTLAIVFLRAVLTYHVCLHLNIPIK
jgi:phage RecT family recombinase